MKELSIEEKAKTYDEVLEWATEAHKVCDSMLKKDLEHLFPELKESKDERIRKTLIKHFEEKLQNGYEWAGIPVNSILTWLEKQGEQKSINNQFTTEQASILDKHIDKFLEQNPAWSEEDEKIYQSILDDTVTETQLGDKQITWLKSLKDRVQPQQNQEWSEEDEKHLNNIINRTKAFGDNSLFGLIKGDIDWLKSLRPQK